MTDNHAANRALVTPGDRYGARIARNSSAVALQAQLIAQETANLAEAFEHFANDGAPAAAAAATVAARRRFITGAGKSFAYASLLATDLSAGLSHVTLVDGAIVRPLDLLSELRQTDLLIAFSFRRYRRETISVATEFARSGGTVIAITDDASAPLASIADQTIVVPTDSASYADSPTTVAATIHLLSTLTTASAKGARRRLTERDRISDALGIYQET
ncbi:SIS domain-containing protein [Saxibacter everestensis]|uniref:SIS domain-containing protein n=1 Tax=Saxibacter everestensis TaxID=2909229 RepID=A0ABY8QPQ3_9MICO|nr:SIS domain-containing protein [Brevibacteriaceae bacterium ZFBP1038]